MGIVDEAFHAFVAEVGLEGIAMGREDGVDMVNARRAFLIYIWYMQ